MNKEVYEKLLLEYKKLDSKYQTAILIYKSRLFYFINEISSIDNFMNLNSKSIFDLLKDKKIFIDKFNKYASIINDINNIFIKNTIFQNIDFSNIYSFIDNIKNVYSLLCDIDIRLDSNMKVYRVVSLNSNEINDISKGNLISTGLEIEDVEPFMVNHCNHLFELDLKPNTRVLVTPYSLLINTNTKVIKILPTKEDGQHEIVLFKDELIMNEINCKNALLDDDNITIHKIETHVKEQEKFI